ncbi:MAG: hypothetical protein KDA05_04730 [Phycisphaerales bacterium]|nr:hypothetical protein [Phycisphaerales bacterium]
MDPERFELERRVGAVLVALIRCDDPVVSLRAIDVFRRLTRERTRRGVGTPFGKAPAGSDPESPRTNWEPS